jgi:VanZ family protein
MRFLRYFWPVILWALLILLLTGLPGKYFPVVPSVWDLLEPDKIVHLLIFFVFTILLTYGLIRYYSVNITSGFFISIAIGTGIVYGGISELLQAYIFVWRQASIYDFIADSAGCFAGYLLFQQVLSKHLKKH